MADDVMKLLAASAAEKPASKKARKPWKWAGPRGDPGPDPWLLRCWREMRGLSQRELSRRCGWGSDPVLCLMEGYKWPITEQRVTVLCQQLGIDREQICTKTRAEVVANAELYVAWVKDGQPNLSTWLLTKKVGN